MDREAWWSTVHRVTKSKIWLKWLRTHTYGLYMYMVYQIYIYSLSDIHYIHYKYIFLDGADVKKLPAMQDMQMWSLGWEDPLEKEMTTHSSILAWEIPGQRSLARYSPWSLRESDITEYLRTHTHKHTHIHTYTHTHIHTHTHTHTHTRCCYFCCSVPKLCLTLCDLMNCNTPGFSVLHQLSEFAQTHVHWASDVDSCLMEINSTKSFGHKKWAIFKNKSKCLDKKCKSKCSTMDADWWGNQENRWKGWILSKKGGVRGENCAGRRGEATKVSADELGGDGKSTQLPSTAVSHLGCSISLPNTRLLSWFTFHWSPSRAAQGYCENHVWPCLSSSSNDFHLTESKALELMSPQTPLPVWVHPLVLGQPQPWSILCGPAQCPRGRNWVSYVGKGWARPRHIRSFLHIGHHEGCWSLCVPVLPHFKLIFIEG